MTYFIYLTSLKDVIWPLEMEGKSNASNKSLWWKEQSLFKH